ncbi:multicomponent Na+:H+ antiporter subunit E [Acetoanaerobium pronyense]|uniref:Multicomponent Na+:H+ antiporter subunit E n=1 Tax=Acetoanaerobium pronyense TaxID=1482736 RepID=A0ABS4KJC9_9FIRM|nr:Na+/H+ antiporter subunit E [Acetoanaerobium pronyense]MBP2027896.1 multicomponent Na+:H+ antiporter subunit E [Acetoanaerobium pronyense]
MRIRKRHGFLIVFIFWMLFSLNLNLNNILLGLISSFVVINITWDFVSDNKIFKIPTLKVLIKYSSNLFLEIYKDSFTHLKRIIKKESDPYIIQVKLPTEDPIVITMVSNAITLTPGTITVDVEKNILYILDIEGNSNKDETINSILDSYKKVFE